MKRVIKQAEPASFAQWKAQANADWQPTYDGLQNPQKRDLHESLLCEQGWVCCYCGRRIDLAHSHIEHFRPQEARPDLALDYANLHASCIRETSPGLPLHCGHAKGSDFDEARVVSPLDMDCERRFLYSLGDGRIYPTDREDEAAKFMLKVLQLDISFLRDRRAETLRRVFDDAFVTSASDEELSQLAEGFRTPDEAGRLDNFGHVVARYAEQMLGR